jgi:hypothetical protein
MCAVDYDQGDFTLAPHERQRTFFVQGIQLHFHSLAPHRGHRSTPFTA